MSWCMTCVDLLKVSQSRTDVPYAGFLRGATGIEVFRKNPPGNVRHQAGSVHVQFVGSHKHLPPLPTYLTTSCFSASRDGNLKVADVAKGTLATPCRMRNW